MRKSISDTGVGYAHYAGGNGPAGSTQLQFPSGVTEWIDLQSTANSFWFLGDNQQPYAWSSAEITRLPLPSGVQRWTRFAAGGLHVLAIGDNGHLYAWGRNYEGQLGTGGQPLEAAAPIKVLPAAWCQCVDGHSGGIHAQPGYRQRLRSLLLGS